MFRLQGTSGKTSKTSDVKFCDGGGVHGVTTRAQRSRRRLEDARTAAVTGGLTIR
jgi:hypothetical protein